MAYDGALQDVRAAVELKVPKRVPVFANSEEFDVKWYGKYTYEQFCQDGDKLAEVTIAAIKEFDYDWAWLQIDDCVEFEPLGVGSQGEGNILRATKGYLPAAAETLANLKMPDVKTAGRIPQKLKALKKIRQAFGDSVVVYGSAAAPYSSVGLFYGLEEAMMLAMTDLKLLADTAEFFVEWQYRYIKAQVEAGAHAIWLGDCNAFSSMLGVEQYMRFAFPSCKKLVDKCRKEMDVIFHLHNSEIAIPHLLAEAKLGVQIISCGPACNIADAKKALAGKNCFSGNLDPIEVLMRGTPKIIEQEVQRIMKTCTPGGGYVFNTGEMNPRDVPVENMKAMVKAAKSFKA